MTRAPLAWASTDQLGALAGRNASTFFSALFVFAVLLCAGLGRNWQAAIYVLSFWHYYLYALAYVFGAVPLDVFKRDAISMKTVSIAALCSVYLAASPDLVSLGFVAFGFLLNLSAANALGSDRTYYGYELTELPPLKVTKFPYSITAHPMLIGNIAAFGGTMINAEFREHWWPLACTHVALNIGLLIMETAVTSARRHESRIPPGGPDGHERPARIMIVCFLGMAGAAFGAAIAAATASLGTWTFDILFGAFLGASCFVYASVLYSQYSNLSLGSSGRSDIIVRSVS